MRRPRAAATLAAALLLAGCGGDAGPEGEERAAAVLEARTEGLTALQQDRLEEARSAFTRLVELAPREAAGYANLAVVHLKEGDAEGARRWAERALERAPEDAEARLILARAHELAGGEEEARGALEAVLEREPDHPRALWTLAAMEEARDAPAARERRIGWLERLVERSPSNVVARLELARALAAAGRADAAAAQLEALRQRLPALPGRSAGALDRALEALREGRAPAARSALEALADGLAVTPLYQADMEVLRGPPGELVGIPRLTFSHEFSLQVQEEEAVLAALRFADATATSGLGELLPGEGAPAVEAPRPGVAVAVGDFGGDGREALYAAVPPGAAGAAADEGRALLLRPELGRFVDAVAEAGLGPPGAATAAAAADWDNDGHTDLFVARDGPDRLYRNRGDGTFEEVTVAAGLGAPGRSLRAVFFDADHDGDLDLFVARDGADLLYRNNGDGTFTERGEDVGLAGSPEARSRDAAFADFDDDGYTDLFVARETGGDRLYRNLGGGRFEDVTETAGLGGGGPSGAVAAGDVDNDGAIDLFVAGLDGGHRLYRNLGDGRFERDRRSAGALGALADLEATDAAFFDFDNDGHLDLLVVGRARGDGRGVALLRNDGTGRFTDASSHLPRGLGAAQGIHVFDYNEDGDLDVLLSGPGARLRLLRNDGGNVNHYLQLRLVGLAAGSGKNNRRGVGSRVEVRAGDLYQARVARGPVVHFGLGSRLKADVVRIEWTNGVPQTLYFPGTDQDLLEEQVLKGSCAFVYTWDGEGYRFVTDAMWKSAIGMPLGIMGGPGDAEGGDGVGAAASAADGAAAGEEAERRAYAPPEASREYLRIPGPALRPDAEGRYRLLLTEELWELAYVDEVKLVAVDHPDSVEVFLDEHFVPPGPPELQLYLAPRRHLPAAATDGKGRDLLPALRAADDEYAVPFLPGRWQGTAELHEVVLDLGEAARRADRVHLFLQGWVYPTDASINVAMAQAGRRPVFPHLQVLDEEGRWVTVVPELSFPAGKAKTVAVELTGRWRSAARKVRIRTEMQIFWDHAFFVTGEAAGPPLPGSPERLAAEGMEGGEAAAHLARVDAPAGTGRPAPALESLPGALPAAAAIPYPGSGMRLTLLRPRSAELVRRGFSREYRKGGRHGPHWFDAKRVSDAPRWLPLRGTATRYGDVLPLLLSRDDRYAILAPGDAVELAFDARAAPELPPGWTRTFVLYTDGWIKDADRNTAAGNTVEPLPFQRQAAYPPERPFPEDEARRLWRETYNTRELGAPRR